MAHRYRVIIIRRAADDLVALCGYIEQQSPQNAPTVAKRLVDALYSLELFPRRDRIHVRQKDATKTVHAMPVPPYIVYYRVDEGREAVRIVTVRHGMQRQPRRFP